MQNIICPLDGLPCTKGCPDRFEDSPEGGCFLTAMMEHSDATIIIGRGDYGQK